MRPGGHLTDPSGDRGDSDAPVVLVGLPHAVPLTFFVVFGCLALVGIGFVIAGELGVGLTLTALFGGLAALFAGSCIPTRIRIDRNGIRFRTRFTTHAVTFAELKAVGAGLKLEGADGSVILELTKAAAQARGFDPGARYHHTIPAPDDVGQEELLGLIRSFWQRAGGDAQTFSVLGDFVASGQTLRKIAGDLVELQQQQASPGAHTPLVIQRPNAGDELAQRGPAANGGHSAAVTRLGTDESGSDDLYCAVMHIRDDAGRLRFGITAGGKATKRLCEEIRRTVQKLVREQRYNPEFGGAIDIALVPSLTPRTEPLTVHMDALLAELGAELRASGSKTTDGRPISLTWCHGLPPSGPGPM